MINIKLTPVPGTTSGGRTTYRVLAGTGRPADRKELCRVRAGNIEACEKSLESILEAALAGLVLDGTTTAAAPQVAEDPRQMTLPGVDADPGEPSGGSGGSGGSDDDPDGSPRD